MISLAMILIQEEVLARIHRDFRGEGIEIPYARHDVSLRELPPELVAWLAGQAREPGASAEGAGRERVAEGRRRK